MELSSSQAKNVWSNTACCNVTLAWGAVHLTCAVVVTGVFASCCLVAVTADHLALKEARLVNAFYSWLRLTHNSQLLAINAGIVELARKALGVDPVARHIRRTALVASISNQRSRLELLLGNIPDVVDQIRLASVDTGNSTVVCED